MVILDYAENVIPLANVLIVTDYFFPGYLGRDSNAILECYSLIYLSFPINNS